MALIVLGDIHAKEKQPFHDAIEDTFEWLAKQPFNIPENNLLLLGDVFDIALNTGPLYRFIHEQLDKLKMKRKLILTGNHDRSSIHGNTLEPFHDRGYEVIDSMFRIEVKGGADMLFLPDGTTQEKINALHQKDYNFIFTHLADESQTLDRSHLDLSSLKGVRIQGHIHQFGNGYLGSNGITRYDERKKDSFLAIVDTEKVSVSYVKIPRYLDYINVVYPDKILPEELRAENPDLRHCILTVSNSIDKEITKAHYEEMFGDSGIQIYFRRIEKKKLQENEDATQENKNPHRTLKEHIADFCGLRKLNPVVEGILHKVLSRRV